MLKTKKKIWVREKPHEGKNGRYGNYWIRKETDELIYVAEKRDRATGIFHLTGSLAIDVETLDEAIKRGVRIVVVHINSSGDKYAAPISRFYSEAAKKDYDKVGGGSLQRYLPMENFVERRRASVM